MVAKTRLWMLQEDEQHARMRLAAYRAKLYSRGAPSPMFAERRLHELERRWQTAAKRLRNAPKKSS